MTTVVYEKPEALVDLRTDAHGIIAASAGTGKTYTLQHLVIEILLEVPDIRLDEILLVTFTVAATSDLKAKIRATLEEIINGWEIARSRDLEMARLVDGAVVAGEDEQVPPSCWAIDREGIQRLRHGLRNFDRAAIYTIHGFCQRILVEHAFANRRLFEQEHVSEEDAIAEGFSEMLRRDVRPGTAHQRWLTAYLGAGNQIDGLREALTGYIRCTAEYRPVERVDLEAFRNFVQNMKAALEGLDPEEWKEEMKPVAQAQKGVTASTSKAVGDRIAILKSEFLPRAGADPVADLFRLNQVFKSKFAYFNKESAQIVLDLAGPVGDALRGIEEYQKDCELLVVQHLGQVLATRVETLKTEQGYFTFDDMVRVVRHTLVDDADGGQLLDSLRDQFRYGLIDEFQDTDEHQWEIFSRIFVDSPARDRHYLYLIGDPKQAIYGFRGGDVYAYLDACDSLAELGARQTDLVDNYRSTPAVLDACNAIFDSQIEREVPLGDRIEYEQGGVKPGKPWLALRIDGEISKAGLTAFHLVTDREKVNVGDIRVGLVEQYADEIRRIVDGDCLFECRSDRDSDEWRPLGARDIYVLARNGVQLDQMAEALRARGVPFAFMKRPGLFQTPEARDIEELLLAIDDPHDRSRMARAWMTPFFDLSLTDVEALADVEGGSEHFERLLRWSRQAGHLDFGELFNRVVEESGIIRRRLLLERGERRLTNYLHILEILAAEGARRVQTVGALAVRLRSFIDEVTLPDGEDVEQQRLETEEEAVQLLTIHASKGLQRGLVFVIPGFSNLSRRNPPFRFHEPHGQGGHRRVEWHANLGSMSAEQKRRHLEEATAEELRLAYVAITRAEFMAYLPWVDGDSTLSRVGSVKKSPFMHIMERLSDLREEPHRGQSVEFRRASIDVDARELPVEEVEAGLREIGGIDEEYFVDEIDADEEARLRQRLLLRRWEVTSYSKLKKGLTTVEPEEEKGDEDPATGVLPGGMATGNFLHLVLEDLEYRQVGEMEREGWLGDEKLREFFELRSRRFGRFDSEAITRAMEVVYDTLRAPVIADGIELTDGVCGVDAESLRREVEFLFPVPEVDPADGMWRRTFRSGARISGGFVRGFVDLLFEHDGKVFFADWKSDRAEPFDDAALQRLVDDRYGDQAALYSLAVSRMLGIDDEDDYDTYFGGFFYFFVRGMGPGNPGRGIYSGRVEWSELQSYERGLGDIIRRAKTRGDERSA